MICRGNSTTVTVEKSGHQFSAFRRFLQEISFLPFDSVTSEYFPMADPTATTSTYSHALLVPYHPFSEYLGEAPPQSYLVSPIFRSRSTCLYLSWTALVGERECRFDIPHKPASY